MAPAVEELSFLAPYAPSLLALTVLCLAVLIQNFLTGPLAFLKEEQAPGMPLRGDHQRLSFRVLRTYSNSVESLPAFGFAVLLAILAGGSPMTINGLAVLHVAFRLAFWAVYYAGIGKVAGGPRTLCYVGGSLSNLALAVIALLKLAR